jgi:cellulose synthase/poly-beta-1,6-N-acetylglucosamine synthase-like glycosyltransferase
MDLFMWILTLVLLLVCVQTSYFFIAVLAAGISRTKHQKLEKGARSTILIPAHNESAVIQNTLASIAPQLSEHDDVLVVADNCTDNTAELIRLFADENKVAIQVVERQHETERGKGYALDFGIRQLVDNPPEIVIIVDADCQVTINALSLLKQEALASNRPVQANYLIEQSNTNNIVGKISAFALILKNVVRQAGTEALGIPCILVGAGMAFPWQSLQSIKLASGNIVEDMQMGIDLAIAGYPPMYCNEAKVRSVLPDDKETALKQRKRWEHGHMQTLLTQVPRLFIAGVKQSRFTLIGHALDLSLPPLSLFIMSSMGLTVLAGIAALFGLGSTAFGVGCIVAIQLLIAAAFAWSGWGRQVISLGELASIPLYILWKIPLYIGFVTKRETQWVRTERETQEENNAGKS